MNKAEAEEIYFRVMAKNGLRDTPVTKAVWLLAWNEAIDFTANQMQERFSAAIAKIAGVNGGEA